MSRPNFFIVGAPKCGTTWLYHYLAQHPDVFVSNPKEPHHFATDLWHPHIEMYRQFSSREAYLRLFSNSGSARAIGEASVWYLFSEAAATAIHEFAPDSRIIIMLRNPVDFVHSLHAESVVNGAEAISDFARAIELSLDDRARLGIRIPPGSRFRHGFDYKRTAKFAEQVARYFDVFGREQVHVVLLEDVRSASSRVQDEVCTFLGVRTGFVASSVEKNPSKAPRLRALHRLVTTQHPLKKALTSMLPLGWRKTIVGKLVLPLIVRTEERSSLDPVVRDALHHEFAGEVGRLHELLGRDLSRWLPDGGVDTGGGMT